MADRREHPSTAEPIAIVGIGCRFPGGADSPERFWDLLVNGIDAIGEFPEGRFDIDAYYDPTPTTPGKIVTRQGGFLRDIDRFDAQFFGISPREAALMDPQQRLLLETAWEALEDAGVAQESLAGSYSGVYVGIWLNDYEAQLYDSDDVELYSTTGGGRYPAAGRLSFALDLRGPSLTVDTACSSSLVAVHLAVQGLRTGETDFALAGGVNVILQPQISLAYSRSGMLAPDGRCKFGDARANGYVRSDGCGVIALKRLRDAHAAGDRIYAVIRGSAVNNDGQGSGFLVQPSADGQVALLRAAYADAGVDPHLVQFVEAHGTGTLAGDPVELRAIGDVLGGGRCSNQPCLVGSVKSNIGHTEGAAGIAGLIKVSLALRNGVIPENLHFADPNPKVQWDALNVAIPTRATPWRDEDTAPVAGVSGFGITGTNAHVVLEAATDPPAADDREPVPGVPVLVPISARSEPALRALASAYADNLRSNTSMTLSDLAHTAATRRSHLSERLAVVGESGEALAGGLSAFAEGRLSASVVRGTAVDQRPRLVFVFPGQGGQWLGMGRRLAATEPVFAEALVRCSVAIESETGWSLWDELHALPEASRLDEIAVVQPAIFGIQVALAALLDYWGLTSDGVVGHSMGEIAAAHVAGILTLDDAAAVICRRSRLLTRVVGRGGMGVVELPLAEAENLLSAYGGRLTVAASNGPTMTVLAGATDDLDHAIGVVQQRGCFARRVRVDVASHSPQVEPLLEDLHQSLIQLAPRQATLAFVSTVAGTSLDGRELDASYWVRNLRQPVLFAPVVLDILRGGECAFLELSPHPVLLGQLQEMARSADGPSVAVGALRREQDEAASLREAVGELWTAGVPVNWKAIAPGTTTLPLPGYPWQRERFWFTGSGRSRGRQKVNGADGESGNPHLGTPMSELAHLPGSRFWQGRIEPTGDASPSAIDGVPIVPGLYAALLAGTAAFGVSGYVEDLCVVDHAMLTSALETQTILIPLSDTSSWSLQLFTRPGSVGPWSLWATARVVAEPPNAEALDLADLQSRMEPDADLGRGHTACWRGECGRLVRLFTDDEPGSSIADVLEMAGAAVLDQQGVRPLLVSRIERIWMPSPNRLDDAAWIYAQHDAAAGETIQLLDNEGVTIATLAGVTMEAPDPELVNRVAMTRIDDWVYNVEWQPVEIRPETPPASRRWIVLGDSTDLALGLEKKLDEYGAPLHGLSGIGDNPEHIERLLRDMLDSAGDSPTEIVDCRSLQLDKDDDPDAVQRACAMSLALVQAVARSSQRSRVRIWFVTRGAQSVGGDVTNPAGAALWGLGRVIANELPEFWGGLIDVGVEPDAQQRSMLIDTITSAGLDREIGLRGGRSFVTRLTRHATTSAERVEIFPDATYVITGGAGGIGLVLARGLAAEGARHIVLLGRSSLSPNAEDAVAAIRDLGVSVAYLRVDIASHAEVASIVAALANGWPPVRGIIHAAGVLSDSTILQLSPADLESVAAPKVAGAWNLINGLASSSLDFVAFCSSVSALMGTPGQGNYAAANAVLDAYASLLRSRGIPAVSIAWGRWGEVGLVNTDDRIAGLDQLGLVPVPPAAGVEAFMRVARSSRANVAVADIAWARYAERQVAVPPRFQALVPNTDTSSSNDTARSGSILDRLQSVRPDERQASLLDHIRELTAAVLRFEGPERIHPGQGFFQMGMDSLMAVELKNRLQHSLDRTLSATLTFDYPTPTALARSLFDELFPEALIDDDVAEAPSIVEDVLDLPDDAVRALLDSELQFLEKELLR